MRTYVHVYVCIVFYKYVYIYIHTYTPCALVVCFKRWFVFGWGKHFLAKATRGPPYPLKKRHRGAPRARGKARGDAQQGLPKQATRGVRGNAKQKTTEKHSWAAKPTRANWQLENLTSTGLFGW